VTPTGRHPIDAAVVYARRGWAVFPCHAAGPVAGCSCGVDCSSPGKHPRVRGGLHSASTDASTIRGWWARWPRANVAIRTGATSGLVVIDVDPAHGGDESMAVLEGTYGPMPPGRTIRTGSGGRHLYFRHPGGIVRNDAGRVLGRGIDLRGDGGYVIAPPSRIAKGAYALLAHGGSVPDLPEWVLERLAERERRPEPRGSSVCAPTAWARAAFDGELGRVRTAAEGTRNDTLNRVAYRLGQIVGAGVLPEEDVERALVSEAVAIGLGEREAVRTVRSGLTDHTLVGGSADHPCPPNDGGTNG
jgi:hypothetical protein